MTDERVFYNREDLWQIPQEIFDGAEQAMEPYYVTMPLPGEVEAEYLFIQPVTPIGKANMIAWIAARNDVPNYGELRVYELPKQELVYGPLQIEARIDQDPEISGQFSLLGSAGIAGDSGQHLSHTGGKEFSLRRTGLSALRYQRLTRVEAGYCGYGYAHCHDGIAECGAG
ncbi:MAG: UPF0182 family protein [Chloroflexi bacterium]|nr:UPF0182 family protein [Chloroflexota bacterium]